MLKSYHCTQPFIITRPSFYYDRNTSEKDITSSIHPSNHSSIFIVNKVKKNFLSKCLECTVNAEGNRADISMLLTQYCALTRAHVIVPWRRFRGRPPQRRRAIVKHLTLRIFFLRLQKHIFTLNPTGNDTICQKGNCSDTGEYCWSLRYPHMLAGSCHLEYSNSGRCSQISLQ